MSNAQTIQSKPKKRGWIRRTAVGAAKGWSYSLGLTSLAQEGSRIAGKASDIGAYVNRKLNERPTYRNESFDEAADRLGLTEADLIRQAKAFNGRAASWFLSTTITLLWLAWLPYSSSPFSHLIICFGLISVTTANAISWRFRFCQIRDQELYSVKQWIAGGVRKW